ATVTAKAGGKSASVKVTVKNPVIAVSSVSLSGGASSLQVGGSTRFTATVAPANATDKTVTWASSDTKVATVDASGTVSAKAAGTATITAKAGGKTASVKVTVSAPKPPVSFTDVSGSTPHSQDILWLAAAGVSTGYTNADGSFRFEGMTVVYRQDMAAFLRREARNRGVGDAASWKPSAADWKRFRDVDRNTPHAEDILWLAHAGISTGWKEADGTSTFRGMSPVARQDMAAFLKRLAAKAGKDGGVKPKTDFTDVTAATPHRAEIQWLGGSGISQGYRNADGSWRFEGMTSVYRQDMAAFIHRLDTQLNK
ncbi:Ig-like domain-containing protein, partial [Bifidobacterium pseudolongum]|uniref:Ig-like domain-containing protein n=1 Tax=Bifidobacterium pseudolongum TaxID=1694 RepID=UPI0010218275